MASLHKASSRLGRFRRTVRLSARHSSTLRPSPGEGTEGLFSNALGPDRILEAHSPVAVDLDGVVTLRMEESGLGARPPISCYSTLYSAVQRWPGNRAWVHQDKTWNYEEYFQQITCSARALIELGLDQNRTVAILGNNSPEWFSAAVGAVFAGGIATGVYTTNTADAVCYQLKHSRANIAVVDSEIQLQKLLSVRSKLPDLRSIVMYGEEESYEDGVINWAEFLQLGASMPGEDLSLRLEQQAINQPAVICYTSGTTSKPKGALLSQDNVTWTCASAVECYSLVEGEEQMISYLPVSHIVAQIADIWMVPSIGGTIHFADKDALKGSLLKTLTEVRPTRFVAVPRVYEKMHQQLEMAFSEAKGAKAGLVKWATEVSSQHYNDILQGGAGKGLQYRIAEKLLLKKIWEKLGLDRCTHGLYSGAAPLSRDTIEFFKGIGLVVSEIYGMTENPNNNANVFDPRGSVIDASKIRQGSVGKSAPGIETRLYLKDSTDGVGEVSSNGRNVFMGYLSDPTKTRETFDRGFWLLSGDMATMEEGFVTIKGRIKDIIITSGGKNIAPFPIEERIKAELGDFVSNCVVVGDMQKHLACLITVRAVLDPVTSEATSQMDAAAWEWCRSLGCKPESITDLVDNRVKYEAVWDAVMEAVDLVNRESSSKAAKVRKFVILPNEFSISGGEMGPTMKLKRHVVESKYAKEIENMYKTDDRTSLWDA